MGKWKARATNLTNQETKREDPNSTADGTDDTDLSRKKAQTAQNGKNVLEQEVTEEAERRLMTDEAWL